MRHGACSLAPRPEAGTPAIVPGRMSAGLEFVVCLAATRTNRWRKVHKWLPVGRASAEVRPRLHASPSG